MPSLAAKQLCLSQQNTNICPRIKTKKAKCQDHKRTRKQILGTLVHDVADEMFLKGFTQNDIDKSGTWKVVSSACIHARNKQTHTKQN